jgi:drug/metabolite transporter (DMT)-like permease
MFTKGVKYMLISTVCFTVMQGLIKFLPYHRIHTFEQTFFRSVGTWILSVIFMLQQNITFKTKNVSLIIVRSVVGFTSMLSFFYILPRIPLGSSVTLKYLGPIFTAILGIFFLNERPKPIQWLYFLISFIGVMLLKGFDARIGLFDFSLALLSAVSGGFLYIILRKMGDDDHPIVVVHYFMLISTVVAGVLMIPYWVTPNLEEYIVFFLIGSAGFVAQLYMTKAFQQQEDANYLAMFKYLEAAYAILIGYFIFGESYGAMSFLGICLIFLGLILTVRLKNAPNKSVKNDLS